jgi:hypothetical protein
MMDDHELAPQLELLMRDMPPDVFAELCGRLSVSPRIPIARYIRRR